MKVLEHFVDTQDFTKEEILKMVHVGLCLKPVSYTHLVLNYYASPYMKGE